MIWKLFTLLCLISEMSCVPRKILDNVYIEQKTNYFGNYIIVYDHYIDGKTYGMPDVTNSCECRSRLRAKSCPVAYFFPDGGSFKCEYTNQKIDAYKIKYKKGATTIIMTDSYNRYYGPTDGGLFFHISGDKVNLTIAMDRCKKNDQRRLATPFTDEQKTAVKYALEDIRQDYVLLGGYKNNGESKWISGEKIDDTVSGSGSTLTMDRDQKFHWKESSAKFRYICVFNPFVAKWDF